MAIRTPRRRSTDQWTEVVDSHEGHHLTLLLPGGVAVAGTVTAAGGLLLVSTDVGQVFVDPDSVSAISGDSSLFRSAHAAALR